jgi:hypothetical protein
LPAETHHRRHDVDAGNRLDLRALAQDREHHTANAGAEVEQSRLRTNRNVAEQDPGADVSD